MIEFNGVETLYYGYTDNQGSLIALTDENGTVVERYAYDPWGARRNPDNWAEKDSRTSWLVNRGYTGHEHLDAFGIINMNGRVYDPATAQFFSPDPFIQAPDNWNNFNRYAYCMNNPVMYTDPSGYNYFKYSNLETESKKKSGGSKHEYAYFPGELGTNMGYVGGFGNGADTVNPYSFNSWWNAYMQSISHGYNGGLDNFLNQYNKQVGKSDFNGKLSFTYTSQKRSTIEMSITIINGTNVSISDLYVYPVITHSYSINIWNGSIESGNGVGNPSFEGLDVVFTTDGSKSAYYKNNTIYTTKSTYNSYIRYGINSKFGNLLMHEYGHFLQEKEYGKLYYYLIGAVSNISYKINVEIFKNPSGYNNTWSEIHANELAYKYFKPSSWNTNKYPIESKTDITNSQFMYSY